jgi:uncharacterized SAM-binding protein YcdF (DUF218 family)
MNSRARGGIIFRLLALLVFLLLLFFLYVIRAPILRAAGEFWVVDDGLHPSDAIIILSDDDYTSSRASRAAQLFRDTWAPRVVASGRMLRPYAGIADLMERDLVERGVAREAVVRFPHRAANTSEEAIALLPLVTSRGWHRILVVTSNYHTRRARYIVHRVFPASIEVRVVPASDPEYPLQNWWQTRIGKKRFVYEVAAYAWAHWELRNPSTSSAPAPAPEPAPARP